MMQPVHDCETYCNMAKPGGGMMQPVHDCETHCNMAKPGGGMMQYLSVTT
ncbi:MAG: hypothetical protein IJ342_07675 [Muribaculaceae bacterium]|nr:hypothetical protein [Muribaculaceae bacterium]